MAFSVKKEKASLAQEIRKGMFPIIEEKVVVELKGFSHTFQCVEGLYVHDVAREGDELVAGFGGQQWNYLISQVPQAALGSWRLRRRVHLQYLMVLEEHITSGDEEPFQTPFGLKKLEWTKAKEKETGDEF